MKLRPSSAHVAILASHESINSYVFRRNIGATFVRCDDVALFLLWVVCCDWDWFDDIIINVLEVGRESWVCWRGQSRRIGFGIYESLFEFRECLCAEHRTFHLIPICSSCSSSIAEHVACTQNLYQEREWLTFANLTLGVMMMCSACREPGEGWTYVKSVPVFLPNTSDTKKIWERTAQGLQTVHSVSYLEYQVRKLRTIHIGANHFDSRFMTS